VSISLKSKGEKMAKRRMKKHEKTKMTQLRFSCKPSTKSLIICDEKLKQNNGETKKWEVKSEREFCGIEKKLSW
jgi:hypothetical protein